MNYFNSLSLRLQLEQLGQCSFMHASEFSGVDKLKGKKLVIVGCGAQGLNQGLNLRDSGLDVSYTLRESAISEKRQSFKNASENKDIKNIFIRVDSLLALKGILNFAEINTHTQKLSRNVKRF